MRLSHCNPTDKASARVCAVCFIARLFNRSGVRDYTTVGNHKNRGVIPKYDFSIPDRQFRGGFLFNKNKRELKMKCSCFIVSAAVACAFVADAVGRTCSGIYSIQCPVTAGSAPCCRLSTETCEQAGCPTPDPGGGDIDDPDCDPCPTVSNIWRVGGTGWQYKISSYSQNRLTCECSPRYQVRCTMGYYGVNLTTSITVPTSANCTRCPDGGMSTAGSTKITDCYIASGSDSTGSFVYDPKCYYTE